MQVSRYTCEIFAGKGNAGSGENTDFTSKKRCFFNKIYSESIDKIRGIKNDLHVGLIPSI